MGAYGGFLTDIEDLVVEALRDSGGCVVALYRETYGGGYVPVLWAPRGEGMPTPSHVASASDLASYLRSNDRYPFEMSSDTFKDGPVRRGLESFGANKLYVVPLQGDVAGRYHLTCGSEDSLGEPARESLRLCATRISSAHESATLRARVRGSILPVLEQGQNIGMYAQSVMDGEIALVEMALGGCTFGQFVHAAGELLGIPGIHIVVEDSDGLILASDEGEHVPESSLQWLSEFTRLPYLDWMEETRRPVLVPLGDEPSAFGRLVVPLFGQRHLLGIVSCHPVTREQVEGHAHELIGLRHGTQYLLRCRQASRSRVLKRTLDSVENERARIALELHDETSQNLVALKVRLATAQRALERGAYDDARGVIEDCSRISDTILDGVNHLAADLRPSELSYLGIRPAIESAAEARLAKQGIRFQITGNACDVRFSALQENMLLAGVKEALSNVARHSLASNVEVEMHEGGGWFTIAVRDDGHGFDLTPERQRGLGIKAMRDCATSIGGDFWVGSKVGVGTTVRFSVPYNVLEEVAGE